MRFLYDFGIAFYCLLTRLASPFNFKAKQWLDGRRDIFARLQAALAKNQKPIAWFHCASLGEFEQARPVIEAYKQTFPEHKVLLTFFSPSGYEIRKNYPLADYIFYLPLDTQTKAEKWVRLVNPTITFFAKYEFWYHYLKALKKQGSVIISFSAIFNKEQIFFKWYGKFYLRFLTYFDCIFVQNSASQELLNSFGIRQVQTAGDTRFDRVAAVANSAVEIKEIELFRGNHTLFIAGSVWEKDAEIILPTLLQTQNIKIIIAPHELSPTFLERLLQMCAGKAIKYSQFKDSDPRKYTVLVIDNIGMLSSLYRYADLAYIGGGFGKGIHNTLEAATFGMPIIFGPNYNKFKEAVDMVHLGCAFPVFSEEEFIVIMKKLSDEDLRKNLSNKAATYVNQNLGATEKIILYCKNLKMNAGNSY